MIKNISYDVRLCCSTMWTRPPPAAERPVPTDPLGHRPTGVSCICSLFSSEKDCWHWTMVQEDLNLNTLGKTMPHICGAYKVRKSIIWAPLNVTCIPTSQDLWHPDNAFEQICTRTYDMREISSYQMNIQRQAPNEFTPNELHRISCQSHAKNTSTHS